MSTWLQRVRGAVGIGLTWAAGWAPIGALTGLVTAAMLHLPLRQFAVVYAVMFGVLGLVGGIIFSSLVRLGEGRRVFSELSLPRFVVWGALGGTLLGGMAVTAGLLGAGFTTVGAAAVAMATLLGASSAAGTLLVARSAERQALLPPPGAPLRDSLRSPQV